MESQTDDMPVTYHQRVKEEKRLAAVKAATELFFEQGYERTSLIQIARRAGLSTGTLFKRYPTKASLFEAIVEEFWALEDGAEPMTVPGNPKSSLRQIGLDYARRMRDPQMIAIYRLIAAEALQFPDLGQMLYDKGKGPYLERLETYLAEEKKAGTYSGRDVHQTSRAFLATIAGQIFWPELLVPGCGGSDHDVAAVVDDAVAMVLDQRSGTK